MALTLAGKRDLLAGRFRDAPLSLFVGLCAAVPAPALDLMDITEPTLGDNGYARQALNADAIDWPTQAEVNGVPYIETRDIVFEAVNAPFDQPVSRLFFCTDATALSGDVLFLSEPLSALRMITPTTPEGERTFRQRIYLR